MYIQLSRFPIFSKRLDVVRALATPDTAFGRKAIETLVRVDTAANVADWLEAVHHFQRLYIIASLGLQAEESILALTDNISYFTWKDYNVLPATPAQKDILASLLYHGDPQRRSPILLNLNDYARHVGELIVQLCIDKGAEFDPWITDPRFQRALLSTLDIAKVEEFGTLMAKRREGGIQRTIGIELDQVVANDIQLSPETVKLYSAAAEARASQYSRNLFFTFARLPTPAGAKIDGMDYQEYVDLFFKMCAVDWDKVNDAHKFLIHMLNAGKILRLTNNDGTDLSMDIEGFTFVNSRVAKNVPGSEVFSAPHRTSVNGIVVAKGFFADELTGKLIENITLEFKDGRCIRYHADQGLEHLERSITVDEGSHFVGEIGIGTNPALKRHIVNSLMVEKIGGSFHIALGRAYTYTDYLGDPVHLDNGNRSKIHWDITTMLYGKEGKMILDGVEIMTDGKFNAPELAYLNGDA